ACLANDAARARRRGNKAPRQPSGERENSPHDGGVESPAPAFPGGLLSPGPKGRCITTLSTQRPNLKPTDRKVAARKKPKDACKLIDAAFALSPITATSCR